jgi:hypothetical protein
VAWRSRIIFDYNIWQKWNFLSCDKLDMGESMIKYTTKVAMSSYSHIFTNKCKKVKSKPFQSLLDHHGAQYWVYSMLYTKFGKLNYTKSKSKVSLT